MSVAITRKRTLETNDTNEKSLQKRTKTDVKKKLEDFITENGITDYFNTKSSLIDLLINNNNPNTVTYEIIVPFSKHVKLIFEKMNELPTMDSLSSVLALRSIFQIARVFIELHTESDKKIYWRINFYIGIPITNEIPTKKNMFDLDQDDNIILELFGNEKDIKSLIDDYGKQISSSYRVLSEYKHYENNEDENEDTIIIDNKQHTLTIDIKKITKICLDEFLVLENNIKNEDLDFSLSKRNVEIEKNKNGKGIDLKIKILIRSGL